MSSNTDNAKLLSISHNESTLLNAKLTAEALFCIISNPSLEQRVRNAVPFAPNQRMLMDANNMKLDNPAMLQTILYLLLVIPKELQDSNTTFLDKPAFNSVALFIIESGTQSTYNNESSNVDIDYYRHLRNAVAHSSCEYTMVNQIQTEPYIIFTDKNDRTRESCSIRMKCGSVSKLVIELLNQISAYYDKKISGVNNA